MPYWSYAEQTAHGGASVQIAAELFGGLLDAEVADRHVAGGEGLLHGVEVVEGDVHELVGVGAAEELRAVRPARSTRQTRVAVVARLEAHDLAPARLPADRAGSRLKGFGFKGGVRCWRSRGSNR